MDKQINILVSDSVTLLKEMIAIPSPSFNEGEVCSHICKWLTSKGVEHERVGNNIIAEHVTDPTNPTLMLCAHIDTVSPCEGYSFDPYMPENSPEGVIQGLGSNDDGASVVSMIAAYRFFHTIGSGAGVKNRATPLAAGGGTRSEGVGGVVFNTCTTTYSMTKESKSGNHGYGGSSVVIAAKALDHISRAILRFIWVEGISFTWIHRVNMSAKHQSRLGWVNNMLCNDIVPDPLMLHTLRCEPIADMTAHGILVKRRRRYRHHLPQQFNRLSSQFLYVFAVSHIISMLFRSV